MESRDTEITLSTGKLLGLFAGLVVVCALFFGFGYSLGRSTAKQSGSLVPAETASAPSPTSASAKPAAKGASVKSPDCPADQNCPGQTQAAPQDLTFYKAVEQQGANASLEKEKKEEPKTSEPSAKSIAVPFKERNSPEPKSAPAAAAPFSGYMVQVAAVSKKEDADMLRSALQQKRYPVVVTSAPTDKLFHVQVGPFSDMKDAETMKGKLAGDGYNPILKK